MFMIMCLARMIYSEHYNSSIKLYGILRYEGVILIFWESLEAKSQKLGLR